MQGIQTTIGTDRNIMDGAMMEPGKVGAALTTAHELSHAQAGLSKGQLSVAEGVAAMVDGDAPSTPGGKGTTGGAAQKEAEAIMGQKKDMNKNNAKSAVERILESGQQQWKDSSISVDLCKQNPGLEPDRIKANISGNVYDSISQDKSFAGASGALHSGFDFASFKSQHKEGSIQFSFAPPPIPGGRPSAVDIDHDLYNDWRHVLEVMRNHATGGTTNQDSIRQILLRRPEVGITPSTDPKWNR